MTRLLSSVALGALILSSTAGFAAEAASSLSGVVEVGGLARYSAEYDNDEGLQYETTLGGAYASFGLWGNIDKARIGFDGYIDGVSFDDIADEESLTPRSVGVIGAHVGTDLDNAYVGIFGATGIYSDYYSDTLLAGYSAGT